MQELQQRQTKPFSDPEHLKKILEEDEVVLKKISAMNLLSEALEIHETLIRKFGGGNGVRDKGALEAALSRPFSTFDG